VAVVTGAAPRGEGVGNGMATAILFAREGAKVVLVNRSAERAEKLARQIRMRAARRRCSRRRCQGGRLRGDGAIRRQPVRSARHPAQQRRHRRAGHAETVTLADWNKVIEANLTTTMLCTRACLPRMKQGGGGSVIMVSSIAGAVGLMGSTGAVAYSTAKAGLHGFTHSVAADYATQNIRANCIIVGSVHTPMVGHMGAEGAGAPPQDGADADRRHGLGRRPWRGLSGIGRVALGHRRAAADRGRAGEPQGLAALAERRSWCQV
jgi:NAD(P)-dependent dehydrogenase (short-subunit alcohol dehydrogenase family)